MMVQFSYASQYFKERMRIFAGDASLENDDTIVAGTMSFIKKALSSN